MLTTDQKVTILRKAGVAVPGYPSRSLRLHRQQQSEAAPISTEKIQTGAEQRTAADQWARTIDALFVEYSAARAAKSLRDAEEARQLGALRQPPDGPTA